jgi:hypothetical protein
LLFESEHKIEEIRGIEYIEAPLGSGDLSRSENFQGILSGMEADMWEEFEEEKKRVEANGGSANDVPVPEERYVRVRTITIE